MPNANDLVAKAASQLGICEQPANSNNTKYGEWYGMNGQPWCDMFVSWCGNEIGASDLVGKFAYCPFHVDWFKRQGQWLDREEKPQAGDIVFFANKGTACHVGIVESRNGSSSVTTIEGNTAAGNNANGGQVQRRVREYGTVGSSWYILGFGRPKWKGEDMQLTDTLKNYNGNDVTVAQILAAIDEGVNNPADPSGRNMNMQMRSHIKWMATKQAGMAEQINAIEDAVKRIEEKLA